MTNLPLDNRSPERKNRDEQIAAEPHLPPPNLAPGVKPQSLESQLHHRRPIAVAGIVENGVVRPLDPMVKLQEHARVIIVAAE